MPTPQMMKMPDAGAPSQSYLFIPFTYLIQTGTVAASAASIIPLVTDQDADFELHCIFATSSLDNAADIRPNNFTFQLTDKTSGRNWSDSQIPQAVAAEVPGGWPMHRPVLIARRTNLSCAFTNLIASNNVMTLTLVGHKVLQYRNP